MLEKQGLEVVGQFQSNRQLRSFLVQPDQPDLYFLDIHLSDGIVFETLQEVEVRTPIIFTTAYDEFAIRAFKQNSVDYLLKPINRNELKRAIDKFREVFQVKVPALDPALISRLLQQPAPTEYRSRVKVQVGDRLRSLKMEEIALLFSENKMTFVQLESGRSYPLDSSLESIAAELDPRQFYRVNRGQVVNIEFISDVVAYSNSRLKVLIHTKKAPDIVVARERVKAFKQWLG